MGMTGMTEIETTGAAARPYHRFHIVYSLKLMQKMLVVCVVPLIQALIAFDLPSLFTALRQELVLLLVLAALAGLLWLRAGWRLDGDGLCLRTGLLVRRQTRLEIRQIAVVELARPPWLRMLSGSRMVLYLAKSRSLPSVTIYLPKRAAAGLAEILLPTRAAQSFYKPTGAERLGLVMLSADLMTTAALLWLSARQTVELLGEDLAGSLDTITWANLSRLEHLAERFLPAGVAWLFTLALVLSCVSLLLSLFKTSRFHVSRNGGVIYFRGGLFTLTERRVRAAAVTVCDVRTTLAARLLRRYPVYLAAGSFDGGDIPVLVYKKGQEALLEALMPEFRLPGPVRRGLYANGRSLPVFLGVPGVLLGVFLVLAGVSAWRLPALTPLLLLPALPALALCLVALEAFFTEDIARGSNRVLTVQYSRGFTRHRLCIFTPDLAVSIRQTPFSELQGRCELRLRLPFFKRVRVRSLEYYRAAGLPLDV